jgi:hypothetical protein
MPTTRPDLFAVMDAYKVLGVEYSANSSEIRRAHRRLARQHHPDRYPAGSAEQQQATGRMAVINDAYRVARDAPLRYHRVSKAADPDTAWSDSELDEAVRRAAAVRKVDLTITIALVVLSVAIVPLLIRGLAPVADLTFWPLYIGLSLVSSIVMWSMLGPRGWQAMYKYLLVVAILRMLHGW